MLFTAASTVSFVLLGIGCFILVFPLQPDQSRAYALLGLLFGCFSLMVGLLFVSLRYSTRKLARGLEEVTGAIREYASGKITPSGLAEGPPELAGLTTTLREMVESFQEKLNEMAEGKRKLEAVLNNMSSGVIFINREGGVDLINPAAESLLSIRSSSAVGKYHIQVVRNSSLSENIDRVLREGKPKKLEIEAIYPIERNLEANLAPITRDSGTAGVIVVLHDTTEIRRLERIKADFVANVSHELRTPVTAIKGFAETLMQGELDNPKAAREFVEIIYRESERLSNLIRDLLELSRIESGTWAPGRETVDMLEVVRHTISNFKAHADKAGLTILTDIPESPVYVTGDADKLVQALGNLVENSIKYTPPGGTITISLKEEGTEATVSVSDTGIGIPPEDLPRIFERFYRVDRARSRKLGGTGLGLSIVKHIIEAHNGRVTVSSEPGRGSTFSLIIPR